MTKRRLLSTTLVFILLLAVNLTLGDLPSCQRAKCSHCQVQFIARMCPNACSPCFGTPDEAEKVESRQAPVTRAKVATYGQTAFVPSNQQTNTFQQTIPNNAGNGPPPQPAPTVQQQVQQVQQPLVRQNYVVSQASAQSPTVQQPYQTSYGGAQVGSQPAFVPQTSALTPYQPVPGFPPSFGAPSAPAASASSPFFNPFQVPTPFQSPAFPVVPFGGLTFAPPLSPASFPSFTPSPFVFGQTLPPPVPPAVVRPSPQQTAPSPYSQPRPQVPQSQQGPQPTYTYSQGQVQQPYRPQVQQITNNYQKTNGAANVVPQQARAYNTGDSQTQVSTYDRSYSSGANNVATANTRANQGQVVQKYVQPSYSTQARPKQILSGSRGILSVQQPRPSPNVNANVQPPLSLPVSQPNQQAIVHGLPNAATVKPPPSLPPSELITGNHIDTPVSTLDKATCPRQPNWEPCITKDLANERFRNCCQRLGDGCAQLCTYDQNLATLQIAVLTGRCPLGKVADMMICASGYEDATSCCEAYGVFEPGYEHCRPYCNPAAGLPNDGMIAEKYRCLAKLSQIQRCFYVTQRP